MQNATLTAAIRKAHRNRGLCPCGRSKPAPGRKTCDECRAYHRAYRARLRGKGVCKCGRLPVAGCRLQAAATANFVERTRGGATETTGTRSSQGTEVTFADAAEKRRRSFCRSTMWTTTEQNIDGRLARVTPCTVG